jgi:hypothetical protein
MSNLRQAAERALEKLEEQLVQVDLESGFQRNLKQIEDEGCLWDEIIALRKALAKSERKELRDHFAAKAMNGLLAAGRDAQYGDSTMDDLAEASYLIADAMLDAREG